MLRQCAFSHDQLTASSYEQIILQYFLAILKLSPLNYLKNLEEMLHQYTCKVISLADLILKPPYNVFPFAKGPRNYLKHNKSEKYLEYLHYYYI